MRTFNFCNRSKKTVLFYFSYITCVLPDFAFIELIHPRNENMFSFSPEYYNYLSTTEKVYYAGQILVTENFIYFDWRSLVIFPPGNEIWRCSTATGTLVAPILTLLKFLFGLLSVPFQVFDQQCQCHVVPSVVLNDLRRRVISDFSRKYSCCYH